MATAGGSNSQSGIAAHDPGASGQAALKLLVVDDDATNRLVLKSVLKKFSYSVIEAENGEIAVEMFRKESPDIVLMDVMMPVMGGYEATAIIKALAEDRFVPVIFLTAVTNEKALAECVACGGDDFLIKPYNHTILKAKIDAQVRLRSLYGAIRAQRDEIEMHHARLQAEHELAGNIFARILNTGNLGAENMRFLLQSKGLCNGDFILAADTPSGSQHVMLGDITGHGLAAAIGAIPVADIFYSMTAKDFGLFDIVLEINRKMKANLPTEFFLAACALEISPDRGSMQVWNGGIPDVIVRDANGGIKTRIPSSHLPLGIVDNSKMDRAMEKVFLSANDRIYMYSDGVIEATSDGGEVYGAERVESIIAGTPVPGQIFDGICSDIRKFGRNKEQDDDITFIEIHNTPSSATGRAQAGHAANINILPVEWSTEYVITADLLRTGDPLSNVSKIISRLCGIEQNNSDISTILSELYINALDHGILRLDSSLKSTPDGFLSYFSRRESLLGELDAGYIRIGFRFRREDNENMLHISVKDSGAGFDPAEFAEKGTGSTGYSGRGISIVRSLCDELTYHDNGSRAEVIYTWPRT